MQAVQPLSPYDREDSLVLEVSVVGKDLIQRLWQPQGKNHSQAPGILEGGHAICSRELYAF